MCKALKRIKIRFLCIQSFLLYRCVLFIYKCSNSLWQPPHAGKLLSVLKHMPQKYGPDAFFNFPGKSAAVCRYFVCLLFYYCHWLFSVVVFFCLIYHCHRHRVSTEFFSLTPMLRLKHAYNKHALSQWKHKYYYIKNRHK